jgi:hypothetical protein
VPLLRLKKNEPGISGSQYATEGMARRGIELKIERRDIEENK